MSGIDLCLVPDRPAPVLIPDVKEAAGVGVGVGENLSYQDVADSLVIMINNYFTEADEVSINFEDDGLIGMDVSLSADLAFSRIQGGFDG